jgi:hypothetical protein
VGGRLGGGVCAAAGNRKALAGDVTRRLQPLAGFRARLTEPLAGSLRGLAGHPDRIPARWRVVPGGGHGGQP